MILKYRFLRHLCWLAAVFTSASAFGWGQRGHEVVNITAAELMASQGAIFFQANKDALAAMAEVPDANWKAHNRTGEASLHFFQWDGYQQSVLGGTLDRLVFSQIFAQLGSDLVRKNGSSVWRVEQIYGKLVEALKDGDWQATLQMAGVMGHYVGDLSQPLHDTSDFDGQSIGQRGLHYLFESQLVSKIDRQQLVDAALQAGGPLRSAMDQASLTNSGTTVRVLAIHEGQEAFSHVNDVLTAAQSNDANAALQDLFAARMGAGAANLAKMWDMAIAEAGVAELPTAAMDVKEPDWFPLLP